jgi:hypothetical protein
VEPPRGVLLDDEEARLEQPARAGAPRPERLGRPVGVALLAIAVQAIGHAIQEPRLPRRL